MRERGTWHSEPQRWSAAAGRLRIAPFPDASEYLVGPTACSPMRAGLAVAFDSFVPGG